MYVEKYSMYYYQSIYVKKMAITLKIIKTELKIFYIIRSI
jgi:hypothetical protein